MPMARSSFKPTPRARCTERPRLRVQTQTKRGVWVTRSRFPDNAQGQLDARIEREWHEINDRAVRVATS